jgi:hypothetical protein
MCEEQPNLLFTTTIIIAKNTGIYILNAVLFFSTVETDCWDGSIVQVEVVDFVPVSHTFHKTIILPVVLYGCVTHLLY